MSEPGSPEDVMSQAPVSPNRASSQDGHDEGCADCGSSPAKAPAAKKKPASKPATKGKAPAAKKAERAGERASGRDRQPRTFLKVPNFKLPSKSKAPKKKTAKPAASKKKPVVRATKGKSTKWFGDVHAIYKLVM